jgi:hypothetical protein
MVRWTGGKAALNGSGPKALFIKRGYVVNRRVLGDICACFVEDTQHELLTNALNMHVISSKPAIILKKMNDMIEKVHPMLAGLERTPGSTCQLLIETSGQLSLRRGLMALQAHCVSFCRLTSTAASPSTLRTLSMLPRLSSFR